MASSSLASPAFAARVPDPTYDSVTEELLKIERNIGLFALTQLPQGATLSLSGLVLLERDAASPLLATEIKKSTKAIT
jgi:hypothetical protein